MQAPPDEHTQRSTSIRGTLGSGARFALLSFALGSFISLAGSIAIARVFGANTVGEYALAFAPTGMLMILGSVREQAALVRELASTPETHT